MLCHEDLVDHLRDGSLEIDGIKQGSVQESSIQVRLSDLFINRSTHEETRVGKGEPYIIRPGGSVDAFTRESVRNLPTDLGVYENRFGVNEERIIEVDFVNKSSLARLGLQVCRKFYRQHEGDEQIPLTILNLNPKHPVAVFSEMPVGALVFMFDLKPRIALAPLPNVGLHVPKIPWTRCHFTYELYGAELLDYVNAEKVIAPFDKKMVGFESIRLTLGNVFLVQGPSKVPYLNPRCDLGETMEKVTVKSGGTFSLEPKGFALGSTEQRIKMPNNLVGHIDQYDLDVTNREVVLPWLRDVSSNPANLVWPGFDGNLTLEFFNPTNRTIRLRPGSVCNDLLLMHTSQSTRFVVSTKYGGSAEPLPCRMHKEYEKPPLVAEQRTPLEVKADKLGLLLRAEDSKTPPTNLRKVMA